MKTVEEIRKSVMAYCETLCPHESNKATLEVGMLKRQSMGSVFYWLHVDGLSTIAIHDNATDDHIFAAYRILGISERDAVETERANTAAIDDLLTATVAQYDSMKESKRVSDICLQESTKALEEMIEMAKAERAKNAALVAALEEIAGFHTDEPTQIWAKNALAANEKGGNG